MSTDVALQAEPREGQGKGANRRLRRLGKVPAVVYGANRPARAIALPLNEVKKRLAHESFYSSIITLQVGDNQEACILKDVQRDPGRGFAMHMDFQRVLADEPIRVSVPLHFRGEEECPGVKLNRGVVSHLMTEVEVVCLPGNLPEYLELDVSGLDIDDTLHLSAIPLPEGVEIPALQHDEEYDQPVVAIHRPRRAEQEEEEAGEAAEAATEEEPATGGEAS